MNATSSTNALHLRGPWRRLYFPNRELFPAPEVSTHRATTLVQLFYAFLLFYAFSRFPAWRLWLSRSGTDTLWPLFWIQMVPWKFGVYLIGGLFLAGSTLAVAWPGSLIARGLAFLGLFQFAALDNSWGKINHSSHLLVFTAFVLLLLPRLRQSERGEILDDEDRQRRYLEVFWGAQAMILLTYTLAGISKLHGAILDIRMVESSLFSPQSLALQLAYDFVNADKTTALGLGEWIIHHPWFGFPLMLGATALEVFSFAVAFKPRLHRIWGLGLIGLHLGIGLAMEVFFFVPIFVLGLMLVASPFAPPDRLLGFQLRDIPWLGPFLSALRAEIRTQRFDPDHLASGQPALEFTLFFDPERSSQGKWTHVLGAEPGPSRFRVLPQTDPAYISYEEQFPYLRSAGGLVVVSDRHGAPEFRVGAEAWLWAAAHLKRSPRRHLFFLLVLPAPLLNWVFR